MIYFAAYLVGLLLCVIVVFYAERKLAAFIQDRYGPMEVGYYGLLQAFADLIKLVQKEEIIPNNADVKLFKLAPIIIFVAVFAGFAVLPVAPNIQPTQLPTGVFFLLAIISADVVGLLMAGWSSNSKFAMIGAMRAISQIVSYEIPMGLCVLAVAMLCQTLDLQSMCFQQGIWAQTQNPAHINYLFGLKSLGIDVSAIGGFLTWNIVRMPLFIVLYVVYYITTLAECNRAPFDLPEGESEIVGGFHTEYSGFRWTIFFLSEYAMMLLLGALGVIMFWGGWNTPLPNFGENLPLAKLTSGNISGISGVLWGAFWLISKTLLVVFSQIWVRWTYPRLRTDQLMFLCWKVLTPVALLFVIMTGVWRLLM
jgi:NADH-quinone oxidoreductase subunit H